MATSAQLRAAGVSQRMQRARVASGVWVRVTPTMVRLASWPDTAEQRLHIALLRAGAAAVASHQSAAWIWGLLPAPERHAVTVSRSVCVKIRGAHVHRLTDPIQVSWHNHFPCTNPLRTLVDLAGVASADDLDRAVDRALQRKLVTVQGLEAELARLSRPGRKGVGALRRALARRGLVGAPHPSVLESITLRLLAQGGITPLAVEVVVGQDGRYRIDTQLTPQVAMEVDGYRYHSSPEQKAADDRRRNELRLAGLTVLVYDWYAVTKEGRRVLAECWQAIGASRRPPPLAPLPPARPDPSRSTGSPAPHPL